LKPNNALTDSQSIITATKPYNHETEPKQAENQKKQANPNFPYLKNAKLRE